LAQSSELVKTPRHSGLISPPPMSVSPPVPLRPHSPSKGLKRPKKTCFVCKSETHLIKDCDFHARKLAQNSYVTKEIHKHNAPMKYSRIPLHKVTTVARTIGAARPTFSKTRPHIDPYAVSKSKAPIRRPFIRHTSPKPSISPPRVNAAKPSAVSAARVNVANPCAVSSARVNAVRIFAVSAARINAVKPFTITAVQHNHTKKVWRPKTLVLDHAFRTTSASMILKRHMTGNISYLFDFEELNGGYVAFGGNPKGDFKLPDASQVLLRVPRENNMYNVNLKNIIPSGDLTCLLAKEMLDESLLWHRRLGHVNFKTINKLVKGNLVRGLPYKVFTNDLTCVACIENLLSLKVKIIRCDNGTEFKNADLNQFCRLKAKEQGDKAVNKDKGKSLVVTITRFMDLNEEFAECINNISNGVSAAGPLVSAAGFEFTNSTNDFTTA
nr:ribonuclease H-like domain-containing protein [Tanacetum cinerariifolium]